MTFFEKREHSLLEKMMPIYGLTIIIFFCYCVKGAHQNFLDMNSNVARINNFRLEDDQETKLDKKNIKVGFYLCKLIF